MMIRALAFHHWLISQSPAEAVEIVDRGAGALERGGLYTIVVVLLLIGGLFYWSKERLQKDFTKKQEEHAAQLLSLMEKQTTVLTKQILISEKVEELLTVVADRLKKEK